MLVKALPRYFKVLDGKEESKFQLLKKSGILDMKIKEAYKVLENCELCERKCHINRTKGELGWCEVGNSPKISSTFVHWGEEPFLVPSFTIFFWSCTFSCQYCQNWEISQRIEEGRNISSKEIANLIDKHSSCKNVNFVGGDPVPCLPFILESLKHVNSNMPVVWNSNFYMSEKSMNLLKSVVDVYLSDFKYGNNKCAERLSKVKNYLEVVERNHTLALKDAELVIRHLVLPNHIECCSKPVLRWISENLGEKAVVNIMDQYRPCWKALEYEEINRLVNKEEFEEVINYAKSLNLNFIK
ncbi:MAG: radical SAM protein [Candidatus Woesearchaeota archaeon]|nr:MAG: radical SAM protein [Candidatus Woesearchaeota archaeon]